MREPRHLRHVVDTEQKYQADVDPTLDSLQLLLQVDPTVADQLHRWLG